MDALCAANLLLYFAATFINDFSIWTFDELVVLLAARIIWAAVIIGLWLLVRRRGRFGWVIAFFAIALLGTGMDQYNMLVMAIVVCYVYLGIRAGHIAVAVSLTLYIVPALLPGVWSAEQLALISLRFVAAIVPPTLIGYVLRRHSEALQLLAVTNEELGQASSDIRAQARLDEDLLLAEERARAARELHDGLGHQLTVAAMSLDYAARTLPSQPDQAMPEVAAARELIAGTLTDVRSWAQALQPVGAQQPGLAGLQSLVQGFASSGMAIELDLPEVRPGLSRRQELFVTRFAQEGLTNALKHARAARIKLTVEADQSQISLQLANDGAVPAEVSEGFGLHSLRERAAELGGQFSAETADGQFVLTARLPLSPIEVGAGVG